MFSALQMFLIQELNFISAFIYKMYFQPEFIHIYMQSETTRVLLHKYENLLYVKITFAHIITFITFMLFLVAFNNHHYPEAQVCYRF